MSEAVNSHQEAMKQIPGMSLDALRQEIEKAHTKPVEANDQQKQAERKELHDALQKRFEELKQSTSVDGSLDALEQKIRTLAQAPTSTPVSSATREVKPSPVTPPNIVEKMQFKATEFAVNVLSNLPLPAGLKNQIFEFITGINNVNVPLIGKITIPGADLLADIGELTNVREEMTAFVRQNPSFIFDPSIDVSLWKSYRDHVKKNPGMSIKTLLQDFQAESKNIPATTQRITISLATLLEPKKSLEPMKASAETSLVSAIQKAWGVKNVEFADGLPSRQGDKITANKSDFQMNGEPVANSKAMELRTLMSRFGNVETIVLSSDPAITIAWNADKRAITLPVGTKDATLQPLQEILAQNKHAKFSRILLKDNDKLGSDNATLSYDDKEGIGTLTAPMNGQMLKALTQFPSLQVNGEDTRWKLDGTTLKRVDQVVNMKKSESTPTVG